MSGEAADLRARQPKAIHSALTVLEEVARCGAGVTARQVSDNLGLPRATAYRLLNLLVQDEYLVRMPDLRGFALGRKVAELAKFVAPPRPPEAVRLIVTDLRERIRGGVHLVRYDGNGLQVIDPDPDFPPTLPATGHRPLHESAMGRLLLAERHSPGALEPGVTEVQEQGFARQLDTLSTGFGCLAVPIRDRDGTLVAALCLAAPRARIEEPGEHLVLLRQAAVALAPLLA
ncbi:IclR family transcriptional regulator [Cryobacterium arcticum]|uniref:Transcriptional regulator n=1 Tax=Cryobacterium arcticum TaxID=670052 RepID=A0A1B1BIT7_9MICO|nr:helix-turn-helix domain-containing protein [Cryobacterium arcticum]ANP72406.1 Transcriptional regulator [Cryobacterium arcticum]